MRGCWTVLDHWASATSAAASSGVDGRTSPRSGAERVGQLFVIQLPYGTDVDWCRNVIARRGRTLEHDGVRYHTSAPTIVPGTDDAPCIQTASGDTTGKALAHPLPF